MAKSNSGTNQARMEHCEIKGDRRRFKARMKADVPRIVVKVRTCQGIVGSQAQNCPRMTSLRLELRQLPLLRLLQRVHNQYPQQALPLQLLPPRAQKRYPQQATLHQLLPTMRQMLSPSHLWSGQLNLWRKVLDCFSRTLTGGVIWYRSYKHNVMARGV